MPLASDLAPKLGDQVLVYITDAGSIRVASETLRYWPHAATVIATDTDGDIFLGWKKDHQPSGSLLYGAIDDCDGRVMVPDIADYHFWAIMSVHVNTPRYLFSILSRAGDTEGPCKQCGRKNDIGIKVCWCCGTANPC